MPALNKNTLTQQVDLPTWEWTRFAPAVSTAVSSTCAADNGDFLQAEHGRYIYYLIANNQFFRYDTWTDVYQQLSNCPIGTSFTAMKYAGAMGVEDRVIAAGANTLTVPATTQQSMRGYDVVIVSGTGAGQRRTVTAVAEPVVVDSGVVSSVSNTAGAVSLSDSSKAWAVNQYAGYSVRIIGNAGVGQMRRILSNTSQVLTVGDSTQVNKNWNSPAIYAPAIGVTAGNQSAYAIETQVLTLDSNWAVQPDSTSVFRVQSGMIFAVSSQASAPFYAIAAYDILTDVWYALPSVSNLFSVTVPCASVERTSENASIWARGVATSGTATTLVDGARGVDAAAWRTNQWAGYWVHIFSGTGAGQIRQIASNTGTTLTWSTAGTAPDATSRYMIMGFDAGTATAGAASTLTDSTKAWTTNRWANYAVRILSGTGAGQIRPIVSNTSTALTIVGAWATNPDNTSVYAIQGDPDKLYIFPDGLAAVLIHNLDSSMPSFGRQQDFGIARNASAAVAGHLPVAISVLTNATTTATATTVAPHQFRVGDLVTVRGATDANFNVTNVAIATVTSSTTFTYTMAGTPAVITIPGAQSTTTLTDASKNWAVNQWAGFNLHIAGNTQAAVRIVSNTATTLTFASAVATAPTNGAARYSICHPGAIGALDFGVATGTQSTTSLQDTTKNWVSSSLVGKRVRLISGTGAPAEAIITGNSQISFGFSALGTAPVTGVTGYVILENTSRGSGSSSQWAFGTTDANFRGRYMFIARGGAAAGFDRWDITTDRFNLMATSPTTETLTTGSMSAYDGQDRIYFHKDATQRIFSLDVVTGKVNGASMYPYAAPTPVLGNRMEVFTTKDGLKYIWLNRASFAECFRCLAFW